MDDEVKSAVKTRRVLAYILSLCKPYPFEIAICFLGAVCGTFFDLIQARYLKDVVDQALAGDKSGFQMAVAAIIVILLAGCAFRYAIKYFSGHLGIRIVQDIRRQLAYRLGRLPSAYLDHSHSGDIVARLNNDVGSIAGFAEWQLVNLIYSPLVIIGVMSYLLIFNWKLLLASMILLPAAMFASRKLGKAISKYAIQLQRSFADYNAVIQDATAGIVTVKAYRLEPVLFAKMQSVTERIRDLQRKTDWRCLFIAPVSMVLQVAPQMSCVLYGGYLTTTGQLTPGELLTFTYLLGFVTGPLSGLPGLIVNVRVTLESAKRVVELVDEPEERSGGEVYALEDAAVPVRFDGVRFGYEERELVLHEFGAEFKPNAMTAIVGPSGCGKSTIVKLLCGFDERYEGSIALYGGELKRWDIKEARAQIAVVSQFSYLFPGSVYDNIAYGNLSATREEVLEAARMANADGFIQAWPDGYDTIVGERGASLSGGQRQRIAIARALLKNAPILVLDEPTSALDAQAEAEVQAVLEQLVHSRTVLVIAHRLSTIREADEIIVMAEGKVADRGTHRELTARNDWYSEMCKRQQAGTEVGEAV
ncbi:ABC transporter ATP-binding protein [Paenibacillus sp. MMS18-CY102]|uniref:ABC transporter ATP-binding protein n=1 Tax=Paenibacillus sp. MMS18-CY102 TaxID=2682849 RepID=UPI001366556A|nr:ABC transporter ATP-binding protein [Paenibacillus sp. MMS18-CY102]MWC28109.1 ATP-binding cassette domain-containing protein [Paenibacillus sp. MMS18-CY102]